MAAVLPAQNGIHANMVDLPSLSEEGIALAPNLGKRFKLEETPVETYEDNATVPKEFLVTDPRSIPNRNWGDDDECKPNFEFQLVDLAPLMRFFDDKPQPGDKEASKKIIEDIGSACETWGFFQVKNHGITEELLDEVIKVSNEFFQLPLEEKEKFAVRPGEIDGYGRLDFKLDGPGPPRTRFWNDSLRHVVRPVPSNKDRIPLNPEAYRPLIEEFTQGMEKILPVVWKALSVYLGLPPDTLQKGQDRDDDESHVKIRLNYYPKCNEPEKVLGAGAHKDFGTLSILLQDEVGGLQVQKRGTTRWLDVPPNKGAYKRTLLINIAKQVEIMSNARLHSMVHRVQVNRNTSRISVGAFASPGPKCIIAPLPEVLEKSGQVPLFTSLLYGDYLMNFSKDVKLGISPQARYEINRN